MEKLLNLYIYLLSNKEIKDSLILNELEFIKNEEMLLTSLGLLKGIFDIVNGFDKTISEIK